ncbi:bifunctional AP-4-A phosphorylase/ADP sulfurylase [Allomyces javanicus]|nr:bifunctional AP-4-A phosphorylase/ADP sulfurylase [Allomyces javanicus]
MSQQLAARIARVFQDARAAGRLVFTATKQIDMTDPVTGHKVSVLHAPSLAEKPGQQPKPVANGDKKPNPFLPYDPAMWVADLDPAHVLLLNKFPVIPEHVLVVTKEFQEQDQPLDARDMTALVPVMNAFQATGKDPFAFYNCGFASGCSQPHRHIQVFPLDHAIPLEQDIAAAAQDPTHTTSTLPFAHYAAPNPRDGHGMHAVYSTLLTQARADFPSADAHNLLVTQRWMMLVPRTQARDPATGLSANAVAYTGSSLVTTDEQIAAVRERGLLTALVEMGCPNPRAVAAAEEEVRD